MIDRRPLRGCSVAVIDFETTGVDPSTCRPVAVAVVIIDALGKSEPRLAYSSLINPGVPIPAEATAIHGITDADVRDAPRPERVCGELIEVVGTRIVCAYNLAYDWLVWWLCRPGPPPPIRGICAFVIARAIDKYEKGKKLEQVCARRDTSLDAHKAESDAFAVAILLPVLLRQLGRGVMREKPWGKTVLEGPWCEPRDLWSVEAFWWWTRRAGAEQERELGEYFATKGKGPLDRTPWLDLKAAYEARDRSPMRGTATPTPTTYEPLPPDWMVPWQAQEEAA